MRYELNQRLRTHSCGQDLTPSRLARAKKEKKKSLKGCEKPLKSVLSGRSQGSDSVSGSRSLIDCRFQFLTVYIRVYDSSASHVLGVRCKDMSEDVSSRQRYDSLAAQMLSSEMTFSLCACWLLACCGGCVLTKQSLWNWWKTDQEEAQRCAMLRIQPGYITLTLRPFNEPCTNILICSLLLCYYLQPTSP